MDRRILLSLVTPIALLPQAGRAQDSAARPVVLPEVNVNEGNARYFEPAPGRNRAVEFSAACRF